MKLVGPTLELADYLAGLKFEDLPEYVIKRAQLSLLDFIGYTVYGCQEEPAKLVIQFVKMLKEKEISTVIGYGIKTSCIQAAFANSFISRISELDDTHRSSRSHPGDIIHPVALAVGEKLESNGRDLITSIVAGYEASLQPQLRQMCKLLRLNSILDAISRASHCQLRVWQLHILLLLT